MLPVDATLPVSKHGKSDIRWFPSFHPVRPVRLGLMAVVFLGLAALGPDTARGQSNGTADSPPWYRKVLVGMEVGPTGHNSAATRATSATPRDSTVGPSSDSVSQPAASTDGVAPL